MYRKTFIEIRTKNIAQNVAVLKERYSDYAYYIGVVKGNAYGHGYGIVPTLIAAGCNYLAVSTLEEALQVREISTDIPILCLEPIHLEEITIATSKNITVTVSSFDYFKQMIELPLSGTLRMHLKINSGMNRLGVSKKEEVKEIVDVCEANAMIVLEGVYTHFATTGVYDMQWDRQLAAFKESVSLIDISRIPVIHAGRSLTLFNHPKIDVCTGIRIGIALYGYNLSHKKHAGFIGWLRDTKRALVARMHQVSATTIEPSVSLVPAFGLYSEIIEIHSVPRGQSVGYGAKYTAQEDCLIGVMPIGYADGFSKRNNGGFVAIGGLRYQIVGGVDMGMTLVKIDVTVKVSDRVELCGDTISINEVASRTRTNVYEVMCALQSYVPRILL